MSLAYTTELTLEQYELLDSLLPPAAATGRPRTVNLMLVIQGILYVLVSGCAWRLLPKQYPPYSTVYYYFRQWRDDGTWKRIHDHLVEWVRVIENRDSSPSAASMDSWSQLASKQQNRLLNLQLFSQMETVKLRPIK